MISQSLGANDEFNSVYAMYEVLKELCLDNADYFKSDDSPVGKKLCESFESLHNNVVSVYPLVDEIRKVAPHYDFNQNIPGNGYRSFVTVVDAFILYGEKICQQVTKTRSSYFFRKSTYLREVETCSQALSSLCVILTHLKTLISWSDPGCLYPRDERSAQELLSESPGINQMCFYGSCLGFQFCESMQVILKGLSILMVSFSEVYYSDGGMLERATNYLWHSSKYVLNPELRARRIVNISQYASVDFCKQFWFLGENELMNRLPNFVHPSVEVNRMISIPPEPLSSPRADGFLVDIPIPSAHTGPAPLSVRLLSAVKRQHMVGEAGSKDSLVPPSKGLIFHCHGGGFVAQSSRSHEAYLRQWAQGLPAPILSVDYSLAPESPFPRALEDALYAYCWALNNTSLLGTTAERVIFAGDSAGANLVIGVAMKCIELGLRPPDGLFLAYVPVVVSFVPSPGRLLCLMDPLLPFGFLMGCLKAYACPPNVYAASNAHEDKLRRTAKAKDSCANTKSMSSSEESFEEISPTELLELDKILGTTNMRQDNQASPPILFPSPEQESVNGQPVLKDEPALFELPQDAVSPGLPNRITRAAGNIATAITSTISSLASRSRSPSMDCADSVAEDDPLLETIMLPCPMDMLKFDVPRDPYLSPYWASDVVLSQFPPVHLVTLQMDPCLDDCVEFAKKLKRLGNPVSLDIMDGLPHGFLNFVMLSKEAYEGSKKCIQRLADLLGLDSNSNTQA